MMIPKNLKVLKTMKVLITFHMMDFLGNKNNSYIHIAPNSKAAFARIVYEKTIMKR